MGVGSVIGCYGIIGAGLTIASNTTIGDECVIGTGELLGDVLGKVGGVLRRESLGGAIDRHCTFFRK
jgi:UDP-3-O-[3-hydroxymyristoyl] glucosamine N-acyltransferase